MGVQTAAKAPKTDSQLLMERETRPCFGVVPHSLLGEQLGEMSWQLKEGEFLLRATGEHYFHYRHGEGLTKERDLDADLSEESLWLNGSVYAAIASLNGLLPIHASAVAMGGQVFAFTGPPGAGKSTLIAALGNRGFPMFCDDTLVLDLSEPDRIICLPGHKRLKLCADAIAMTGANREEKVSGTVDKFYATPVSGSSATALPLASLVFLDDAGEAGIVPLSAGESMFRMQDDHQTTNLFAAAQQLDRAGRFAYLARLARQVAMARLARPRDRARFDDSVALAARYIEGLAF